jgi:hypothetical protein
LGDLREKQVGIAKGIIADITEGTGGESKCSSLQKSGHVYLASWQSDEEKVNAFFSTSARCERQKRYFICEECDGEKSNRIFFSKCEMAKKVTVLWSASARWQKK